MTDRAQFEAMLEALINDDQAAAKDIFHQIVVGKSREIYEELLESDFSQDQGNPYGKKDEEEEMSEDGEEEPMAEEGEEEEPMAEEDEEDAGSEEDDSEEPEDDAEDEFDGEEEADGDIEDRVMDLEDALEDLKAEFEQLMAGEEHEEHDHPGMHDLGGDDMGDMGADSEMDDLMEYVNKVASPQHGDNGSNAKSVVAGKNDMGGTTANIANGHREVTADVGAKSVVTGPGVMGPGVKSNPDASKNVNVPGGKAGKTAFKSQVKGGGIDRQSGFDREGQLAGTGAHGQSSAKNTQSPLRARK